MGIDSVHRDYSRMLDAWKRCHAAAEGGDEVRRGGFLAKPDRANWTNEDEDDWKLYNALAVYYNGTGRTLEGLVGQVFKVPPAVEAPDTAKPLLAEITGDYLPVTEVTRLAVTEVLKRGRIGFLVDYPPGDESGMTLADRMKNGRRPVLAVYFAESIKDWNVVRVNGKVQLSFLKLFETLSEQSPEDEFARVEIQQYRVMDLFAQAPGAPAHYRVRLYRKDDMGKWAQYGEDLFPLIAGERFDFIPFWFLGPNGVSERVEQPPIQDVAALNLAHYQNSADYEWGIHFAGSPTPVFSGEFAVPASEDPKEKDEPLEIRIGSRSGIHFSDANGKAAFLEFTGQGLSAIVEAMRMKWDTMAALGARILAPEKKAVEASDTARIHREGETSVLANIANVVSEATTAAARLIVEWAKAGEPDQVRISLNTEYSDPGMDAGMLKEIVAAWMADALTIEDLYHNFQRTGMLHPETDEEEWKRKIEEGAPLPAPSKTGEAARQKAAAGAGDGKDED